MDSAVHKKYEEIIQYLKQSLQATGDDEKNFKNKIEDFRLQGLYLFVLILDLIVIV
jgi:hypothetical protein